MDSYNNTFIIEILKANNYFELYSGYTGILYYYNNRNNITFIIDKNINDKLRITKGNNTEVIPASEVFKKIKEYEI